MWVSTHSGIIRFEFYDIHCVCGQGKLPCASVVLTIYVTRGGTRLLSVAAYPSAQRQLLRLRLQSCETKRVLAPQNIQPHHHFRRIEVCVFVCARVRVFKWDNGVNLKTMLCACQGFEAEPSTIVPRGIYPESLPTTLLNSTSVRFYNTIVRLNRFLFGCFSPLPSLKPCPPAPSPLLVVLVCLRYPILSPGSV